MLQFPTINPVALQVGPLKIHWYGLMYLIGFFAAWMLLTYRATAARWTAEEIADIMFYGALGAIIGGRLGCVIFFGLSYYLAHPLEIFEIWKGGMSFHGGLIGVSIALWMYSRRCRKPYFSVMDFIAPVAPIGLGAGRIGNFINGELWGRPTDMPWGMVFPNADLVSRHPSQWYEFFLEGVLLFIILWCYSAKPKPHMAVSALFLASYGIFRIVAEFFRYPDPPWDLMFGGWFTMGQVLSLPMVLLGIVLLIVSYRGKTGESIS